MLVNVNILVKVKLSRMLSFLSSSSPLSSSSDQAWFQWHGAEIHSSHACKQINWLSSTVNFNSSENTRFHLLNIFFLFKPFRYIWASWALLLSGRYWPSLCIWRYYVIDDWMWCILIVLAFVIHFTGFVSDS